MGATIEVYGVELVVAIEGSVIINGGVAANLQVAGIVNGLTAAGAITLNSELFGGQQTLALAIC